MKKVVVILSFFFSISFLFSQNFEIEWQQCFGGTESDETTDIIGILDGYLIVGSTTSDDGDVSDNHGGYDAWIIKIDGEGILLWEKTYGGTKGDGCGRIIPDDDGNYYLLCGSNSSDGDISHDPYPDTWDFWIVKIDSSGNILWDRIVGGNGDETLWTGTATDDGGVVALGWSGSEDGDVSVNYGLYDMWMVKLNSEGEIEWDFTLGTDWQDYGQAIIQTSEGGFLVGGSSKLTGGGNLDCECHGQSDGVLVKLDADRNIEWQQCYGGSDYDGITALIEINDGYVFGGYVNSNDGDISGWHGEHDFWVVKIDFNGNIIWQNPLGGSKSETGDKILQITGGGFIAIGNTQSNDGDVSGNHTLSEYYHDIWMVKLSSEGALLSQQCIGGERNEIVNFGVVQKSDYNFVIAGQSDYGPSYDVQCNVHHVPGIPYPDFWVFEVYDTTVSITETPGDVALKVYPNPANNYVIFELPVISTPSSVALAKAESVEKSPQNNPQSPPQITITNTLGQQVAQLEVKDNKTVWDTRKVKPGVYFYTLAVNGISKSGKVVISK